jgi:hypothetical protein
MCNEILGNYTKKEDQLMTATFGTREKWRLNRVMDALSFEYPDYERLDEEAGGLKRKRVVSVLTRQAQWSIEAGKKKWLTKKPKLTLEPSSPKKRKVISSDRGEEEGPSPPKHLEKTRSVASNGVTEILEVMTAPLPFPMLSRLGSGLTSLLQPQKKNVEGSAEAEEDKDQKRPMMNLMRAILNTPPPAIQKEVTLAITDQGPQQAENSGGPLGTTMSKIDRLIANVAPGKSTGGQLLQRLQHRRKRELRKPLRKTEASIFRTWVANNFPKWIY